MPDAGVDPSPAGTRRATAVQRLVTVAVATVATAAVWLLAHVVFDVALQAKSGNAVRTVTLSGVVTTTVVVGFAAWALLAILERVTSAARTIFIAVGVVFLLISLLGPLSAETGAAKLVLTAEHLLAALIIIPGLARTTRQR
ncbi:hypothetical protein EV385_6112 [Krasilnikovia cinnamomea]|uniref:Uncharacterized protein n=2 Tax=Krasilnikovia cinnamomea TaxID=349313 RepID=A0A4Q7ZSK3_9ACTN|nr:hypothetical protein EV385_6112 [Krasilnikovia cinnamomea]